MLTDMKPIGVNRRNQIIRQLEGWKDVIHVEPATGFPFLGTRAGYGWSYHANDDERRGYHDRAYMIINHYLTVGEITILERFGIPLVPSDSRGLGNEITKMVQQRAAEVKGRTLYPDPIPQPDIPALLLRASRAIYEDDLQSIITELELYKVKVSAVNAEVERLNDLYWDIP